MDKIISSLLGWFDFFIHIYIHITATINAVIFVAKRNQATTAEDLILQRRRARSANIPQNQQQQIHVQPSRKLSNTTNSLIKKSQLVVSKETRSIGPFEKIPNEILMVIFELLDQNDLYSCSTVTKHWNELITPILWRSPVPTYSILSCSPSFTSFDKKSNISHHHQKSHISPGFPLHISRYGHAVKSLDLSLIAPYVTDCTLRHIVRYCPQLTSLNLSHCRLITNEGLRCLTGHATKQNNIKVLVLQNCRQITDLGLSYIKETCHSLETLHLGGCNRISDNGVIGVVTASEDSIRRINLSDCTRVTGSTLHKIAQICGPRLEWLDISRTKAIRHSHLDYLVNLCPNIIRLNVSMKRRRSLQELSDQLSTARRQQHIFNSNDHEEQLDDGELENVQSNTAFENDLINPLHELIDLLNQFNIQPNLTDSSAQHQRLLIEQQRGRDPVSNQTIELMAIHLKKLQHLNISHWTCLNDKAIHTLSIHSHCLTYLNLIGCQRVTKKALKYLSDLCERKSTCITLTDLMISPKNSCKSYNRSEHPTWASNLTASVSSSSSSEESGNNPKPSSKRNRGNIKA
ncbi:unnamed protein product [Mucor hiemalis]